MKGISPIVASVLLIAVTMTIAGVLAYWSSSFVTTSLPGENSTTSECRLAQFEFLNCVYNTTGQYVIFSVNNVRSKDLNLTAFLQYSNGTVGGGIVINQTLTGSPPNNIRSYTLTGVASDFSNLLVKTNCPELSRSTTCSR